MSRDEAPLLSADGWEPKRILLRLGPAAEPWECLPRILMGAAVVQGPERIRQLAGRYAQLSRQCVPRLKQMRDDPVFAARKAKLSEVAEALVGLPARLVGVEARSQNEMRGLSAGLAGDDLNTLVECGARAILGTELKNMPSPIGIEYAIQNATAAPTLEYAETWVERIWPGRPLDGIVLFNPEELSGRVVIVYDDGRLAYDPGEQVTR